jgi:hypothetical protein
LKRPRVCFRRSCKWSPGRRALEYRDAKLAGALGLRRRRTPALPGCRRRSEADRTGQKGCLLRPIRESPRTRRLAAAESGVHTDSKPGRRSKGARTYLWRHVGHMFSCLGCI